MSVIIKNAQLLLPDGRIVFGNLSFENGVITALSENEIASGYSDEVYDAAGNYLSAGFIDLHTHGAGGYDFMDGSEEAFLKAAEMHARHGTTSLCPTTLSSTNDELFETLGLHLEGPYFSYNQRGAQDPKYLRNPSPDEYLKILDASDEILRWSLAPELEGALDFGKELRARHILPSIAHTDAIFEDILLAYQAGFSHVTHLYSCMSSITRRNAYRYAGAIEAAYMIDDMTVEIIADGVHLPKSLLQFVYKFKGADRIALVTDSMRGAGTHAGASMLGSLKRGQPVIIEDGVAKLPDRSAFAGSVATADRLVRTMVQVAGVPLPDAVKMMTATPARIIGVNDRKGRIEIGLDADLVLFDKEIDIKMTIVNGRIVYNSI